MKYQHPKERPFIARQMQVHELKHLRLHTVLVFLFYELFNFFFVTLYNIYNED